MCLIYLRMWRWGCTLSPPLRRPHPAPAAASRCPAGGATTTSRPPRALQRTTKAQRWLLASQTEQKDRGAAGAVRAQTEVGRCVLKDCTVPGEPLPHLAAPPRRPPRLQQSPPCCCCRRSRCWVIRVVGTREAVRGKVRGKVRGEVVTGRAPLHRGAQVHARSAEEIGYHSSKVLVPGYHSGRCEYAPRGRAGGSTRQAAAGQLRLWAQLCIWAWAWAHLEMP